MKGSGGRFTERFSEEEQATLKRAAQIIRREALRSGDVSIPGFGRFYIRTQVCEESCPWQDRDRQKFLKYVMRFRPFLATRKSVDTSRTFLT